MEKVVMTVGASSTREIELRFMSAPDVDTDP